MTAVPLDQVTDRLLLQSLGSTICPACGGPKALRKTVCGTCWRKLPITTAQALYRRVGHGYREAVIAAMQALGVAAVKTDRDACEGLVARQCASPADSARTAAARAHNPARQTGEHPSADRPTGPLT